MKRNLMILALASAIVAMMAFAAPAMAHNNDNNNNVTNHHNDCFGCGFNHRFNDEFCCDGFFLVGNPFDEEDFFFEDCPFAGDTEGIVNEFDCFD